MTVTANNPLRVLFLTAEYDPFAKVGGLGDYSGSLPKAIKGLTTSKSREIDIRVAIPFHGSFSPDLPEFKKISDIQVKNKRSESKGSAFEFSHFGVPIYLIRRAGRASGYKYIYNPSQLLDARKYIFFSLAVTDLVKKIGWRPDVVHANDWHAALSLYQFAELRKYDSFFKKVNLLQTIHNMPYLGEGTRYVLKEFGISPIKAEFVPPWATLLPLPMGLVSSDWISTVSPSYADELTTEEFGDGLAEFFVHNQQRTSGILNGIDIKIWDPEKDLEIENQFDFNSISARNKNKVSVLHELGMETDVEKPLLVFISRLTSQKGIDIILQSLPEILDLEWNAIILGCGQENYESGLKRLESSLPNRIRAILEFNNPLAHKLYAAGDILLMPSLYEPCGLSQMIAMRYGCIPVARAVGGLKDSIISEPDSQSTGYLFKNPDNEAFIHCLRIALKDFKDAEKWGKIQQRAMKKDFSWNKSARKYVDLYEQMILG